MRIGIYDPYLDDLGGGEKYMMTIASCLSKDHEVDIFWDQPKDLEDLNQRFALDITKLRVVKNIFSPTISFFQRFQDSLKYDRIIILSDGSIPVLACKKLLLHIQQPLEQMQSTSFWGKIKLRRVDKLFCNSLYTKSFIAKNFHLKTSVLYPPVLLHPKKVSKKNYILHVGRFRVANIKNGDYKKQSVMIDAFKTMVDKGLKDWEFVVATSIKEADKEEFAKLQERAKGYPIKFLINQTNSALWEIYSKAKIYWHASGYGEDLKNHPEYAEHFGISTVEAMGAGCVPIVINAGGQREIVTNGANGFLWDTLEELKSKTLQVIKDKKLLEKLSAKAIERAHDFSGDRFCKEVYTLIQ